MIHDHTAATHDLHEPILIGFAAFALVSALYVFLRYQVPHLRRKRAQKRQE